MKKIVVDASTTLKWVFVEDGSDRAQRLLKDYLEERVLLVAPKFWCVEVANAIKSAVQARKITQKKGRDLLIKIYKVKPKLAETEEIMSLAFDTACKLQISVYDSLYLTLATEIGAIFVTADQKLLVKLPKKTNGSLL